MNQAKELIVNSVRLFGGFKEDQVAVNKLSILAWITAGSKKVNVPGTSQLKITFLIGSCFDRAMILFVPKKHQLSSLPWDVRLCLLLPLNLWEG